MPHELHLFLPAHPFDPAAKAFTIEEGIVGAGAAPPALHCTPAEAVARLRQMADFIEGNLVKPPPPEPADAGAFVVELAQLERLWKAKTLTDDEFKAAKKRLFAKNEPAARPK